MALRTQSSVAPAVAQESNYLFTDFTDGRVYTFTPTDLNTGATGQTVTYTIAAAVDTTAAVMVGLIAKKLVAAASTRPLIQALTIVDGGAAVLNVKASVAGAPWSWAVTISGGGTPPAETVVKANSGPYDFSSAGNYAEGIVPTTNDNIIFTGTVLYNLYQSGVTFGHLTLTRGSNGSVPHVGDIGTAPFKCTCTGATVFDGIFNFDLNASAVIVLIKGTSTVATGALAGILTSSNLTRVDQYGGSVGYAAYAGETETAATVNIYGGRAVIGTGETLTTLNIDGATADVELKCAATTVNAIDGALVTNGTGAITTLNQNAAAVTPNSSGTITTLNKKGDGLLDLNQSRVARTITTLNAGGAVGKIHYDSTIVTVGTLNAYTAGAAIDSPVQIAA